MLEALERMDEHDRRWANSSYARPQPPTVTRHSPPSAITSQPSVAWVDIKCVRQSGTWTRHFHRPEKAGRIHLRDLLWPFSRAFHKATPWFYESKITLSLSLPRLISTLSLVYVSYLLPLPLNWDKTCLRGSLCVVLANYDPWPWPKEYLAAWSVRSSCLRVNFTTQYTDWGSWRDSW